MVHSGSESIGQESASRGGGPYAYCKPFPRGELECEVQFSFSTGERLQLKACLAALLPEVCYMGELVLGKGLGGGGA